jgi:Zn-finger nucleic acid-binding protein
VEEKAMNGTNQPDAGDKLRCPECGGQLKPLRTPAQITLHSCGSCRTAWLDGGAIADAGWGAGLPQPLASQPAGRVCPRCSAGLLDLSYDSSKGQIHVDFCESCSGIRVAQAQMAALRELAATTGLPGAKARATEEAGEAGEPRSTGVVAPASGGGRRSGVLIALLLCAVLIGGGAYLLRGRGMPGAGPAGSATESMSAPVAQHDPGPFFTVIPALKRFQEKSGRWPNDADELNRFSRENQLLFDRSKFDLLTWQKKEDGGLIVEYRNQGSKDSQTFFVSPPVKMSGAKR